MGEEMNKNFFREEIQMAKRYTKKYSVLLIIREMKIITMRYQFTTESWAHIRKTAATNVGINCWWEY